MEYTFEEDWLRAVRAYGSVTIERNDDNTTSAFVTKLGRKHLVGIMEGSLATLSVGNEIVVLKVVSERAFYKLTIERVTRNIQELERSDDPGRHQKLRLAKALLGSMETALKRLE